ncbi:hypothetical protein [Roseovarius spongiae]|nr:hypothetical protein [Roseovarius spongiae]
MSDAALSACQSLRPNWDGAPVGAWAEALTLFTTPAALILLLASALVIRFRSAAGALVACLGWAALISAFTFFDMSGGQRAAAMAGGCIGKPTLFIALAMALCAAMVLLTTRGPRT